jgi:hypothetical protein
LCFAFPAGTRDAFPCDRASVSGRFREFLERCSWLASDRYFDGVIANMTRECLLDVYCRQEESVMASQNACRDNQRLPKSDRFAYICGLIQASWRIQRPAEERATGTEEAWIVATREMSDAVCRGVVAILNCCLGKLVNPNLEFEFRVVRQDSWHRWIPSTLWLLAPESQSN